MPSNRSLPVGDGNAFDVDRARGTPTTDRGWTVSTRIRRVTSPVAQGTFSYAMTVRVGDRDASTQGARANGARPEQRRATDGRRSRSSNASGRRAVDRASSFACPGNLPDAPWYALVQLKGEGKGNGPFGVYWEDERLVLKKSASQSYGSTRMHNVWVAASPTPRDRWIKLLVHVKWSTASDGAYELLGDLADGQGFRQLKRLTTGWTLKYDSSGAPVNVGARIGIYRLAGPRDSAVYFDGFTVAGTRAAATNRAFGESL